MHMGAITPDGFMQHIMEFRHQKHGGYLSKSAHDNKRSSLYHLFRLHNRLGYPEAFNQELGNLLKFFSSECHPSSRACTATGSTATSTVAEGFSQRGEGSNECRVVP